METKKINNLELRIFNNFEEVSCGAAEIFMKESKRVLRKKKTFTVSFCGGTTPKRFFELLATDFNQKIFWPKVHIFWGDERAEKENPESSFQISYLLLLEKIIKKAPSFRNNIHRIRMELGLLDGAKEYEKEINEFAPRGFDLSFNGAGADGHRNGVFPESSKIDWKNEIWNLKKSVKVFGYTLPSEINFYTQRITLTPWFLNKSKVNILMLSGLEKAELLKKITLEKNNYHKKNLPALTFNDVSTIILTDKLAASKV